MDSIAQTKKRQKKYFWLTKLRKHEILQSKIFSTPQKTPENPTLANNTYGSTADEYAWGKFCWLPKVKDFNEKDYDFQIGDTPLAHEIQRQMSELARRKKLEANR